MLAEDEDADVVCGRGVCGTAGCSGAGCGSVARYEEYAASTIADAAGGPTDASTCAMVAGATAGAAAGGSEGLGADVAGAPTAAGVLAGVVVVAVVVVVAGDTSVAGASADGADSLVRGATEGATYAVGARSTAGCQSTPTPPAPASPPTAATCEALEAGALTGVREPSESLARAARRTLRSSCGGVYIHLEADAATLRSGASKPAPPAGRAAVETIGCDGVPIATRDAPAGGDSMPAVRGALVAGAMWAAETERRANAGTAAIATTPATAAVPIHHIADDRCTTPPSGWSTAGARRPSTSHVRSKEHTHLVATSHDRSRRAALRERGNPGRSAHRDRSDCSLLATRM